MNKPLRCCNCNKVIAEEVSIQAGTVKITCKCGTVNTVEAVPKQQVPYGERVELRLKDGYKERAIAVDGKGNVLEAHPDDIYAVNLNTATGQHSFVKK